MKFNSTRNNLSSVDAAYAIVNGLSEDGGLFVPQSVPKITADKLELWKNASYCEIAYEILKDYLTDFSENELKSCIEKAYKSFDTEEVVPLHKLDETTSVMELWHGPTCAFKDVALQILPHLLTVSAKKTGIDKTIVILVATSGDTGKAALVGFSDVPGTKIQVFFPNNGVSEIQKLQMVTQEGDNVCSCAANGNFDDVQSNVKRIFTDENFNNTLSDKGYMLSSANSINWGRLVPQIVYYVNAYCNLLRNNQIKAGEEINFVVPTGNFGNILAGYFAKAAGVPIKKLICASNENNVLTDFIRTGVYDKNRKFSLTISPSMDILISSNLERLLYILSNRNDSEIAGYMKELSQNGSYQVSDSIQKQIDDIFWAGFCDDEQTKKTIKDTFEQYHYLIDTHTAVAKAVCDQYQKETGDTAKTVIASTASPFKFNGSVYQALFGKPDMISEFDLLFALSDKTGVPVPKPLAELKEKEIRFEQVCEISQMKQMVEEFLK